MKKADAQISISIDVECPYCEEYFNLLTTSEDTWLYEEGYIYTKSFGYGQWGCNNFNEKVTCPDCKEQFTVENINY